LGEARMLPAAAYVDDAVLAWEREHLFAPSWMCLGRADVVRRAGEQVAIAVGPSSVLVTRDAGAALHVVANVCRHRGHELLAVGSRAERNVVQCPYHAWTYELDSHLRATPRVPAQPPGCDDLALIPVRHAEWGGWLFVDVSGTAPDFAEHLGGLAGVAEPWHSEDLVVAASHSYAVDANWKLVHENYHECYHCPLIHPELCRVSPPTSGANFDGMAGAWVGGTMDLAEGATTMSLSGERPGAPLPGLDAARQRHVLYAGLGWDLLISAHPDYVLTHRLVAVSPSRTAIECQWLFPRDVVWGGHFDPGYAVNFWDLTNRQDWAAIESVQRGIANPNFVPGPFAPNEDAVHRFVSRVAAAYFGY
jgi:Rieske 2Fe-2S family protein